MLGLRALCELDRQHLDRRFARQHAGFFALAAARAVIGMHRRQQHGVTIRARVVHAFERDRLINYRAHAIAHVAAQAEKVEAVLLIDEYCQAHPGLTDIGELTHERPTRTGDNTGDVLAHLTGDVARLEIRRARGHSVAQLGQLEGVVGAITHTQTTAYAGRKKFAFGQCTRWTDGGGRQGRRLLRIHSRTECEQTRATGHARRILEEAATWQRSRVCGTAAGLHFVVHSPREPAPGAVPPVGGAQGSRLLLVRPSSP